MLELNLCFEKYSYSFKCNSCHIFTENFYLMLVLIFIKFNYVTIMFLKFINIIIILFLLIIFYVFINHLLFIIIVAIHF